MTRVKKNFFDDEEEDDFEKFDNDEDFIKMRVSEPDEEDYEDEKEELGEPWGGKEYSLGKGLSFFDVDMVIVLLLMLYHFILLFREG